MATDQQNESTELAPIETDQSGRIIDAAHLPENLAIMQIDNEAIRAMATARPRDHKAIMRELVDQLEAYPSLAEKAIYNKPVGRDKKGKMKYARGLSIRAAETIAGIWGYNKSSASAEPIDGDKARITGTFVDYQKGVVYQDSGVLSMFYKDSNGKMRKTPEDRFWSLTTRGEKAKYRRNAILGVMPAGLKAEMMIKSEEIIDNLLDDATVTKMVTYFAEKGIDEATLERHLGRQRELGWTKDDRKDLLFISNAIENEETTIQEVFGDVMQPEDDREKAKPKGIAGDDLTGKGKGTPEKADKQPDAGPTEAEIRFDELAERLGVVDTKTACDGLASVVKKESLLSDDDKQELLDRISRRREEIHDSRGERSNG